MISYGCLIDPGPKCLLNGKLYGNKPDDFKGRWYHYYERGLSYMEGKCYQAALNDFKKSIKVRPEDSSWAKMYGMHFITYYPHRESGIIYYLMHNESSNPEPLLYTASNELELSLLNASTAKAHKFLKKVKKSLLLFEKDKLSKPKLTINTIDGKPFIKDQLILCSKNNIQICGKVYAKQFISEITIGYKHIEIQETKNEFDINETIYLDHGLHHIPITAKNFLGGITKAMLMVKIDCVGPDITIIEYNKNNFLKGYIKDDSEIKTLTAQIDDKNFFLTPEPDGDFLLFFDGFEDHIIIFSDDILNNTSRIILNKNLYSHNLHQMTAMNNTICNDNSNIYTTKKNMIIFHGLNDTETVFLKQIYIEGQIQGFQNITSFVLNDNNKDINKINSLKDIGEIKGFAHKMSLNIGINDLYVKVEDEYGLKTLEKLRIIRKVPSILQNKYRFKSKLINIDNLSSLYSNLIPIKFTSILSNNEREIFQNFLFENITNKKRFLLYKNDYNDADVNGVIICDTSKTNLGVEISLRLVEPESRKILVVVDDYSESINDTALNNIALNLSDKLADKFPIFFGSIEKQIGNKFIANIQDPKSLLNPPPCFYERMPVIIYSYKTEKKNLITNNSLGSDTEIIAFAKVIGKMANPWSFLGGAYEEHIIGYKVASK